jgi:thymidylate synthase (FAD)
MDEIERLWNPEVKLISVTANAEELIEKAYRNCYQSKPAETPEERRNFIKKCIQRGHLSPLEFAEATFEIVGSRVFTHQLVRHRIASYAQESQRYVKVKDPSYIVIPPKIQESTETLDIFLKAVTKAFEAYIALLNLGIKKEDARYILPQATKSKIFVKMNFRAWRHFL